MIITTEQALQHSIEAYEDVGTTIQQLGASCTITIREDTAIVAFRGSQHINDFVDDIKINLTATCRLGDGMVHYGFFDHYIRIADKLINYLNINKIKKVIATGHSLGGALATIFAYDCFHNHRFNVIQVTVFGCPRVFDWKLAYEYDKHLKNVTERFQNNCDIACRSPKFAYKHVGNNNYITSNKTIKRKTSYLFRCIDIIKGIVKGLTEFKAKSISDHYTQSYNNVITHLSNKGLIQ